MRKGWGRPIILVELKKKKKSLSIKEEVTDSMASKKKKKKKKRMVEKNTFGWPLTLICQLGTHSGFQILGLRLGYCCWSGLWN